MSDQDVDPSPVPVRLSLMSDPEPQGEDPVCTDTEHSRDYELPGFVISCSTHHFFFFLHKHADPV